MDSKERIKAGNEKVQDMPFYKWLMNYMTYSQAVIIHQSPGWSTKDEQCLMWAAQDILMKNTQSLKDELIHRYNRDQCCPCCKQLKSEES